MAYNDGMVAAVDRRLRGFYNQVGVVLALIPERGEWIMLGEGLVVLVLVALVVLIPIVALICALSALAGGAQRRRQYTRLEVTLLRCLERIRALEERLGVVGPVEKRPREDHAPQWARPAYAAKPVPPKPEPEPEAEPQPAPTHAQDIWVEEEPESEPACPELVFEPVEPVRPDVAAAVPTAARPPAPPDEEERWEDLEGKLGRQWMTWGGAIVLMLSAGFLVKHAHDNDWFGPSMRVLIGVLIGLATGVAGERFLRRQMRMLGQGLIGLGFALVMIALYAAYGWYGALLSREVVFALMTLVAVAGMTVAIRHDALTIAFLAMLGGLLIPYMLHTGQDSRDALFAYLLLLNAGVLGVAYFKRWRGLDALAFVGTWIYFTGWYFKYGIRYEHVGILPASLWVGAFFIAFTALPFINCLRKREAIAGDRFAMTIANVMLAFGWAYVLLRADHQHMLGLATSAMAASFLALGVLTRKRTPSGEHAVLSFIAIAIALFTIAIPIHFDLHVVTIAWAIEAALLLYLAYRYDYWPVRDGSVILLLLAGVRVFTIEWPMHTVRFPLILNSDFLSAIFVAGAGAVYALVHHRNRALSRVADSQVKLIVGIASALLALVLVNIEFWQWLDFAGHGESARWVAMLLCGAGSLAFLAAGLGLRSVHTRVTGFVPLAVVLYFALLEYGAGLEEGMQMFGNMRFLAALFGTSVVFMFAQAYRRAESPCTEQEREVADGVLASAIILLTILTGIELWQGLVFAGHEYLARCLSPLVALSGAIACMGCGVRLRSLQLRGMGLVVLAGAGLLAIRPFLLEMDAGYILLVNGRFLAALAVVATLFGFARVLWSADEDRIAAQAVCGAGIVALFLLLSVETYLYFQEAVANARHAAWAAQMSLTILWGIYATVMLLIGFSKNVRTMRLSALGLFAATALKLVLVDMASIEGIYRVLAFMVLGCLMIGASYVYHRVEKRMLAASSTTSEQHSDGEGEA